MSVGVISVLQGLILGSVPLPGTSSVSVPLSPPSACAQCHGGYDDAAAHDTWAGSAMGHSARDPLFLAALVQAESDRPGVGDFCLRCHAPEAWLQGRCFPTDASALEEADSGVTCSVCHRMDPTPWVRNGQYVVGDDSYLRGPYGDSAAQHHTQYSMWLADSRLCGTCHDLMNPLVLRRELNGTQTTNFFPEQTTYSEWLASDFAREGKDCVDCHMPDVAGRIAEVPGADLPSRADRSSHALAGGNAFLLDAIAFLKPGLGLSAELARGRVRIEAMLESAAEINISAPAKVRRGEIFNIEIRVTNLSGHKLPTGYPDGRRVFLSLNASELNLHRGLYDEATGEPIEPVVNYRVEHGQFSIGPGSHLALNDTVFFDNRIPPRGFVSTSTISPVGKSYPETALGHLAHYDVQTITATVVCDAQWTSVQVEAGLWYQSTTKKHLETLISGAAMSPHADRLELVADSVSFAPIQMVSKTIEIMLDPDSSCETPDVGFALDVSSVDQGVTDPDAAVSDVGVESTDPQYCACRTTKRTRSYGDYWALMVLFCLCRLRSCVSRAKRALSKFSA